MLRKTVASRRATNAIIVTFTCYFMNAWLYFEVACDEVIFNVCIYMHIQSIYMHIHCVVLNIALEAQNILQGDNLFPWIWYVV